MEPQVAVVRPGSRHADPARSMLLRTWSWCCSRRHSAIRPQDDRALHKKPDRGQAFWIVVIQCSCVTNQIHRENTPRIRVLPPQVLVVASQFGQKRGLLASVTNRQAESWLRYRRILRDLQRLGQNPTEVSLPGMRHVNRVRPDLLQTQIANKADCEPRSKALGRFLWESRAVEIRR